jgi:ATP-dependent protease ClpP protease subunit
MSIVADKRFMTKNAHAMIHELSSGNQGKYTELRSYCKFLDQLHDKLVSIYCDKTKKSRDEIEKLLRNETWFTADEYLKYGFVEEIK